MDYKEAHRVVDGLCKKLEFLNGVRDALSLALRFEQSKLEVETEIKEQRILLSDLKHELNDLGARRSDLKRDLDEGKELRKRHLDDLERGFETEKMRLTTKFDEEMKFRDGRLLALGQDIKDLGEQHGAKVKQFEAKERIARSQMEEAMKDLEAARRGDGQLHNHR